MLPAAFNAVVNEIYQSDIKCGHIEDAESHEFDLISKF